MDSSSTPSSTRAILLAGILLGGYISLLIGLVYLGQQHLRQSMFDQAQLAIGKQAAAIGYFFTEQQDEITEFTKNPALNNFFANRALGMSMQYGLRASLLAVRDELERLRSRKKLDGKPVYSRISFVDQNGSILVAVGEATDSPDRSSLHIPESVLPAALHVTMVNGICYANFTGTIDYHNQVVGLIIAEINLVEVLTPLMEQSTNRDISRRLMLMGPGGNILIPTGQSDAVELTGDDGSMIVAPVADTGFSLRGTLDLGFVQSPLTSSWFLIALALITLPVLAGLYYLLRLNNNHLILQARYLISHKQQQELELFRKRLDLSADLIAVIDPESSRFLDVNHTMCEFFSLSRDELLKRRLTDLSGRYKTRAQWIEFLRQLKTQGRITAEDSGVHPNGSAFVVEFNAHYAIDEAQDSIVVILRDISERKQSEIALQQANQRVTSVLDGIDAAVYVADMENYEVLYVNPKVKQLLGDVIGKKCWQSLQVSQSGPCPFCTNDKLLDANGNSTGIYNWEFQNTATGYWYHCSDRAIPWDDGRYVRLEVATDISTRVQDEKALKEAHQQLESLAYYDPLTKLANRRLFSDRLMQAFARADRTKKKLAVCYLDLDGFKDINDTLGHELGDKILIQVSERLIKALRGEDTVARWGGDEFALLINGQENEEECANTLDRLIGRFAAPNTVEGHIFNLTASIGVTIYPQDSGDPDTLLRHADQAMYLAKQRGRNRYYFFDPDQDRRVRAHRQLIGRVAEAIELGELRLYYQPKVDMSSGKVFGVEALIRWQHPEKGLLYPIEFLPIIEGHEIQYQLDWWILSTAINQAHLWYSDGLELSVSINISPNTIQQPGFTSRLSTLIKQVGIDGRMIELEILESRAVDDLDTVSSIIKACAQFGVSFALDDYGTGYSSLTYIRRLPVQTLKIDQSFVKDILIDKDDLNIVQGVIGLANAFERNVIAEGVEKIEIGVRLIELGCHLAQGFGIAKPMPVDEFGIWLRQYQFPREWIETKKLPATYIYHRTENF